MGITLFRSTPLQIYSEGLRFLYVFVVFLALFVFGVLFLDLTWIDVISHSTEGTAGNAGGDGKVSLQDGKSVVWFIRASCEHLGRHTDTESSLMTLIVSSPDQGVGSMAAAIFVIMDLDSADRCMHASSLSMFNGCMMGGENVV